MPYIRKFWLKRLYVQVTHDQITIPHVTVSPDVDASPLPAAPAGSPVSSVPAAPARWSLAVSSRLVVGWSQVVSWSPPPRPAGVNAISNWFKEMC